MSGTSKGEHGGAAPAGLTLEGVSHRFGAHDVLRDVDVCIASGEVVCLLGPSGCGKTTTLRLAAGLEPLQQGRVTIAGREVAVPGREVPPEQRRVGLMFQDYALFPHLSVLDNVAFGLRALKPAARRDRAMTLLELIGLAARAETYPHVLSGGEQQRVALARALAPAPVVMLFDEPFSGLDTRLRARIRDETLHILKELEVATLLVTHDAEEAMFMADRIALMREGRIVQLGSPRELYDAPVDAFAASFFSEVNEFAGRVSGGAVATPLGAVPTELSEGSSAVVLVRPEELVVEPGGAGGVNVPSDNGVAGDVVAAHPLGALTLLDIVVDGGEQRITARVAAAGAPEAGCKVFIRLDRSRAFVFPANQKT